MTVVAHVIDEANGLLFKLQLINTSAKLNENTDYNIFDWNQLKQ